MTLCYMFVNLISHEIVFRRQNNTIIMAIRAEFYVTEGDLYAFWVSPWETGESRGYTAGGGPGLPASGIDTKKE